MIFPLDFPASIGDLLGLRIHVGLAWLIIFVSFLLLHFVNILHYYCQCTLLLLQSNKCNMQPKHGHLLLSGGLGLPPHQSGP